MSHRCLGQEHATGTVRSKAVCPPVDFTSLEDLRAVAMVSSNAFHQEYEQVQGTAAATLGRYQM